jgi:hypothetical protein
VDAHDRHGRFGGGALVRRQCGHPAINISPSITRCCVPPFKTMPLQSARVSVRTTRPSTHVTVVILPPPPLLLSRNVSREDLDQYSLESQQRCAAAQV